MSQKQSPTPIARPAEGDRPAQAVKEHLEEAAALASSFLKPVGLHSLGELVGRAHDLGKFGNRFQEYIRNPDAFEGKRDHSSAGAQLIWSAWGKGSPADILAGQIAALCVASHHGGLMDCLSPSGKDVFSARMEKGDRETNRTSALENSDDGVLSKLGAILDKSTIPGRVHESFREIAAHAGKGCPRSFTLGLFCRLVFSALIDADRMSAAGRHESPQPEWPVLLERLEDKLKEFDQTSEVNTVRADISDACLEFASKSKGMYKLSVPTGGGKTLSSLRFALKHAALNNMARVIYVIPYTSIIEQNAEETRKILERPGEPLTVLEHHSNLVQSKDPKDDSDPDEDSRAERLLGENWDAPVIFTTSVQFLNALFDGSTRSARRMHRLSDAVIIFDEVQTLPVKTVHLFNNAVNFLVESCGSTVVMCTATQPLLDQVAPEKGAIRFTGSASECEMAPPHMKLFDRLKRVEVVDRCEKKGWPEEDMASFILGRAAHSTNFLAVANTRKWARRMYEACAPKFEKTYHLSAAMCPAHRSDILNRIKDRIRPDVQAPTICISTQLIEAGVDVDFNEGLRFRAGWDSVAQTAGRINRNGRNAAGRLFVVKPHEESIQCLADIIEGKKNAGRILSDFKKNPGLFDHDLLSPELMERYYQYYFYERASEMSYNVEIKDVLPRKDTLLSLLSVNTLSFREYIHDHGKKRPPFHLCQSFKTAGRLFRAIDAPTQAVVVPYGDEGKELVAELCVHRFDPEERRQLLRRAQRFSVNIYPNERNKLGNAVIETYRDSGVFYLDEQYYSEELGVVTTPVSPMSLLIG